MTSPFVIQLMNNPSVSSRHRTPRLHPPPTEIDRTPPRPFVPAAPALFAGRAREIGRVTRALARLPMAVLYGVSGVGKSALAYACGAAWAGPAVYARAGAGRPLASLVGDLCMALGEAAAGGPPFDAPDDDEACGAALADALDARGALLLLDDVDALPPASADALLRALGERLRRGRVIVTSGRRLGAPGQYDRLELLVRGLDEASARKLWRGLDRLRGPKNGFREAYRRSQGYPASLRRAHAGDLPAGDPHAPLVDSLDRDALLVAAALALTPEPLGPEPLRALLPDGRADAARKQLADRLLVEVDGAGACSLYAPARDAVLAALAPRGVRVADTHLACAAAPAGPVRPADDARDLAPHEAPPDDTVVLDARRHELRAGGRVLRLGERMVLRGLLYALVSSPNAALSKEDLVSTVWAVRYHPLRHDNALFVNVGRLRKALAGTGLVVRNHKGGYSLSAPDSFVYIPPANVA
jgi:AAA ATPase-like protein